MAIRFVSVRFGGVFRVAPQEVAAAEGPGKPRGHRHQVLLVSEGHKFLRTGSDTFRRRLAKYEAQRLTTPKTRRARLHEQVERKGGPPRRRGVPEDCKCERKEFLRWFFWLLQIGVVF